MIRISNLPDENELVMAVIKKILPYGAFCSLPEYGNLEAFLHVSEVAPRWIKNIHEFISEGQRYVVKVVRVDRTKNQVDVSIKRVNEQEKKNKLELIQSEKRGAKLLEVAIKESGAKIEIAAVKEKIEDEFGDVFSCFKDASENGEKALASVDLPEKLKACIIEIAKKNIKKPVVDVSTVVTFVSYNPGGIEDIRKAFSIEGAEVQYLGAPRYKIVLTAGDYKTGEKKLDQVLERIKEYADKNDCDFSSDRES